MAASVEDRQVKIWSEDTPGGTWSGPTTVPGVAPVAPHVTLLLRPDGRLQLFALHVPLERERWTAPPAGVLQDVVTSIQKPGSMSFGPWQSLGSPDAGQFNGVPTAAIDGSGRTFVFAKNSTGAISRTVLDAGVWSAWTAISSSDQDILDGIAAITRSDGVVEVFATMRAGGTILRYQQSGTSFIASPTSLTGAASAPTVSKNLDGSLQIVYREAQTGPEKYGRVLTARTSGPSGGFGASVALFGDAGTGPVAAIRREGSGHIMLFERNTWGGLSATQQNAANSSISGDWQLLGLMEEYPAAATDALGRVVVVAKGSDGKLYLQRESSAAEVGGFGGWVQVGN